MKHKIVGFLFLGIVFAGAVASVYWWEYHGQVAASIRQNDVLPCVQVITPARNPANGEITEFSTPCEVPPGWEIVY